MKYLTIYTENSHYDELLEYAKDFKYIEKLETGEKDLQEMQETEEIDEGDTREEIIANVRAGYEEMLLIMQGKGNTRPLEDFLRELEEESNEL